MSNRANRNPNARRKMLEERRARMQKNTPTQPAATTPAPVKPKGQQPKPGVSQPAGTPQKVNPGNAIQTNEAALDVLKTESQKQNDAAVDKANKQAASWGPPKRSAEANQRRQEIIRGYPGRVMDAFGGQTQPSSQQVAGGAPATEFVGKPAVLSGEDFKRKDDPSNIKTMELSGEEFKRKDAPENIRTAAAGDAGKKTGTPIVDSEGNEIGVLPGPETLTGPEADAKRLEEAYAKDREYAAIEPFLRAEGAVDDLRQYGRELQQRSLGQTADRMEADNAAFKRRMEEEMAKSDALNTLRSGGSVSGQDAQRLGITQEFAESLGGSVDYTDFVKNAPVPEALLRETALYGEGLTGRRVGFDAEYDAARGQQIAEDQRLRQQQAMESRGIPQGVSDETAQLALLNKIRAERPVDQTKLDQQRAERREQGAQRRADSREARLRDMTPDEVANERKMLEITERASKMKAKDEQAKLVQERFDAQLENVRSRKAENQALIERLDEQIKSGDLSVTETADANKERRALLKIQGELAMLERSIANKKALAGFDIGMVKEFKKYFTDPDEYKLFTQKHDMTPEEYLDTQLGPGVSGLFKQSYEIQ